MNEALLERVLKSPRLPSLPAIALEVIDLVQQKNVDIKQIANTIKHDPALSSKILKTVNSSFYGQAYSISTVSHALVVLGLNSVKTLALGFSLVSNLAEAGGAGFDHMTFWKRSLFTATASKTLAARTGVVQQEECFLGGLLQDLGMLTMCQTLGREYAKLVIESKGVHHKLMHLERTKLDLGHPEVGGKLAESWSLPPLLSGAIRYHHDPESAPGDIRELVGCIALGNYAAEVLIANESAAGEALIHFQRKANEFNGMAASEAESILREVHSQTAEMQRLFDLPTGSLGNADDILATANEALLNLTMQAQQQSTQLEQQNKQLNTEAYTDALTGAANRRAFDREVEESFGQATADAQISVLFMDVDHFKQFNDTHGHAVGDQVLICFAHTLKDAVGEAGTVYRYGGEEFAIVCKATDRKSAAKLAEHVRICVQDKARITNESGEELGITASIGVAAHEGSTFPSAELLVKAADQGVYAAKKAGRNCVRVFAPRRRPIAA
jgi:diguanylate cyclase (GGDEF)-like protein